MWHIDHIVPSASFKFESLDDPDFLICWGLDNLRPLEAKTNMSKGAKLDWNFELEDETVH